jgi:competence protein ComEC
MRVWTSLMIIVVALITLVTKESLLLPDGKVHMYFFDVGQGDATLIVSPSGKQILIDGGPNLSVLEHLKKYMSFFDRSLDLIVITHPDKDHITALKEVIRRYNVDFILLTGVKHDTAMYKNLLKKVLQKNIKIIAPDPKKDIDMGDGLILDIVSIHNKEIESHVKNMNNSSIVLRALYKNTSVLLTGDVEESEEQNILASGAPLYANILKVPHHGSNTSSSTGFLLEVSPEISVVSAGKNNKYNHPHKKIMERYKSFNMPVLNTAKIGTISLAL